MLLALTIAAASMAATAQASADAPAITPPLTESTRSTSSIPPEERAALASLLGGETWAHRALGTMRLEAYGPEIATPMLEARLRDPAWQVRAFATAVAARIRAPIDLGAALAAEEHPRVVRTLLRCRGAFPPERLERGLEVLLKSRSESERLLGVELALASGGSERIDEAEETFVSVVLRSSAAEIGALSPRLAAISTAPDLRRDHRWRAWLRSNRGKLGLHGAYLVPPAEDQAAWAAYSPNAIAALDSREFLGLVEYVRDLSTRRLDLAIAIDCTASMSGELAEVQGGLDDLMLFARDVTAGVRIGVVAYRDRRDRFETIAQDFTPSLDVARAWLWRLTAEGGGDRPEAVHPALRRLYTELAWDRDRTGVAILVGDAPPHPGWGAACISLAARAAAAGVVTHAISAAAPAEIDEADDESSSPRPRRARTGPPEHFPEIASAGSGRLVELADGDSLVAEIVGLTLGDRFDLAMRGFFDAYLSVCR